MGLFYTNELPGHSLGNDYPRRSYLIFSLIIRSHNFKNLTVSGPNLFFRPLPCGIQNLIGPMDFLTSNCPLQNLHSAFPAATPPKPKSFQETRASIKNPIFS